MPPLSDENDDFGELGRFVANVGYVRAREHAGDLEVSGAVELAVEETGAAAKEDRGDVDVQLVDFRGLYGRDRPGEGLAGDEIVEAVTLGRGLTSARSAR